jgi:hypothetical protein
VPTSPRQDKPDGLVRTVFPCMAQPLWQHMPQMMDMTWGMGIGGLIVLILVVLVIAALVKYIFFR